MAGIIMTASKLIEQLSALSDEQKQLPVCAHDGGNPSDSMEVTGFVIGETWFDKKPCIHILS